MSQMTMTRWGAILKREWLWLLVPALIGVAAAYPLASAEPPVSWTATERVAVFSVPATVAEDFKPAALIAVAGMPTVLRSAETSLGLPTGALDGTFSAKSDGVDPSTVVFSAMGASEAESLARLEATVAAVKERSLMPFAYAVQTAAEQAKSFASVSAALEKRIAELDKLAAAAPLAEKAAIAQSQALYTQQLNDYRTRTLAAERFPELVTITTLMLASASRAMTSSVPG